MKKIDLSKIASSNATQITDAIGKKLKENKDKVKDKVNLSKLAEKLAERREKAVSEEENDKE